MSLDIGRSLYWLCTKRRDLVFRNIRAAAEYVAETMPRMMTEDTWEDGFIEGLAKIERRDDRFLVTTVSEEMFKQATLIIWSKKEDTLKKLEETKMAVVKEYSKHRDGKT